MSCFSQNWLAFHYVSYSFQKNNLEKLTQVMTFVPHKYKILIQLYPNVCLKIFYVFGHHPKIGAPCMTFRLIVCLFFSQMDSIKIIHFSWSISYGNLNQFFLYLKYMTRNNRQTPKQKHLIFRISLVKLVSYGLEMGFHFVICCRLFFLNSKALSFWLILPLACIIQQFAPFLGNKENISLLPKYVKQVKASHTW